MQQMFDKANEFGSTGDAKLDENILSFWNQKVDDYFTIKNGMQTGKIGKQEGNLALFLENENDLDVNFRLEVIESSLLEILKIYSSSSLLGDADLAK